MLGVLLIILFYFAYLILGYIILSIFSKALVAWAYKAPNSCLFISAWPLWPVVITWYYLQFRNDRKEKKDA